MTQYSVFKKMKELQLFDDGEGKIKIHNYNSSLMMIICLNYYYGDSLLLVIEVFVQFEMTRGV